MSRTSASPLTACLTAVLVSSTLLGPPGEHQRPAGLREAVRLATEGTDRWREAGFEREPDLMINRPFLDEPLARL